MIDFQSLPFRKGVGICLFNSSGQIFVAERRDSRGAWQMPQGGVQKEEIPENAVFREMKEEIGTDKAVIVAKIPEALRYEFPDWLQNRRMASDGMGGVIFRGKYRGQEQTWFALKFTGDDSEIDLSGEADPEFPEFIAWKWVELSEVLDLIVPFKKPVYEKIVEAFASVAEGIRAGRI